jgi:hypothetical protein
VGSGEARGRGKGAQTRAKESGKVLGEAKGGLAKARPKGSRERREAKGREMLSIETFRSAFPYCLARVRLPLSPPPSRPFLSELRTRDPWTKRPPRIDRPVGHYDNHFPVGRLCCWRRSFSQSPDVFPSPPPTPYPYPYP